VNVLPEILDFFKETTLVDSLTHIQATLNQKWRYSHYIHGNVAFEAGRVAGRVEEEIRIVATAVEIIWASILILDDIVDRDEIRYRIPSAWKQSGHGPSTIEMVEGLLSGIQIVKHAGLQKRILQAAYDTVNAMRKITQAPLTSNLDGLISWYKMLGALSAFSLSWPWDQPGFEEIAHLETCAGQLVNDCNDCFGKKAIRRKFPDLRNRQCTLLMGIANEFFQEKNIADSILQAKTEESIAMIAAEIKALLKKKPTAIMGPFDDWMKKASELAAGQVKINKKIGAWLTNRVFNNRIFWRSKLQRLIEEDSQL